MVPVRGKGYIWGDALDALQGHVSGPARGAGCISKRQKRITLLLLVTAPVRGVGCIRKW